MRTSQRESSQQKFRRQGFIKAMLEVLELPKSGQGAEDALAGEEFFEQLRSNLSSRGAVIIRDSKFNLMTERLLQCIHELFSLSQEEKDRNRLDKSKGIYSGFSALASERDFREQFHLFIGFHKDDHVSDLKAPNVCPSSLASPSSPWSECVSEHMEFMQELGESFLNALMDQEWHRGQGSQSYSLLKMIKYSRTGFGARSGTPPHIDWSYLTLVCQDSNPGLEILDSAGTWETIKLEPDSLLVIVGELLELASAGRYPAVPHRFKITEALQERVSAPFFLSPDLDQVVPWTEKTDGHERNLAESVEHVHRVFAPGEVSGPIQFGASEVNRKVAGRWCYRPGCCR